MSEQLAVNAFGETVLHKVTMPKKLIRELSPEERKIYNADRQAAHRAKKKKELELVEERQRVEQEAMQQHVVKPEEKALDDVPQKWLDAFHSFLDQDTSLDKIAVELNRQWVYRFDVQTIRDLQKFIFAVENKYIQVDECIRTLGQYPEVVLSEIAKSLQTRPGFNAESDLIDLRKSPTFMEIYRDALWKAYSLDEKYQSLMDARMWSVVKQEFQRVCQD